MGLQWRIAKSSTQAKHIPLGWRQESPALPVAIWYGMWYVDGCSRHSNDAITHVGSVNSIRAPTPGLGHHTSCLVII